MAHGKVGQFIVFAISVLHQRVEYRSVELPRTTGKHRCDCCASSP
jgi:hypothetical protein